MSAVASDMFAEGKMRVVRRYGGMEGRRGVASFCFLSTHQHYESQFEECSQPDLY